MIQIPVKKSLMEIKSLVRIFKMIRVKLKLYFPLIKSLQTLLLVFSGVAGYMSARPDNSDFILFASLCGSLFLTISGSTILNMYFDRDLDSRMGRTKKRPLPSGKVKPLEVLIFGMIFSSAGLIWSVTLSFKYCLILLAGLLIDVLVYTMWLKRKTPWSIIWGGISGGMPILAGRVLGIGSIDGIGILFAFAILLWIPTHIMTFSMNYYEDYHKAGIPTFPSVYGFKHTRLIISLSSVGAALSIGIGFLILGLSIGYIRLLAILTVGFFGIVIFGMLKPSRVINNGLFKYASLYMMISLIMIIVGT
ncbi:MAG: protoheme IX farnesyltransferase [Candidatus Aminicenantes bacterium]|nr:protoheme IX farnesyltransferase [Candidatus Aminicenantes bacterium]